jgi:ADP-heptose:LPS heptosyltransferase
MQNDPGSFYNIIRGKKKILVLDLGFLGDSIHLLPALWEIRQGLPNAHIEVMVADHIQSLMGLVPWIDKTSGYPRYPKGPQWYEDFRRVLKLWKEKYDVIINLNGSDRSCFLTLAIGAPYRLGRVPDEPNALMRLSFTHTVAIPYLTMPLYRSRWECIKEAGFPTDSPLFNVSVPNGVQNKVDALLEGKRNFIHVNPFTVEDYKELPLQILAEFLNTMQDPLVLSCAPTERERNKLRALISLLFKKPWKVFDGSLSIQELAAVIGRSKLHMGGDSGGIHVAVMMNVPTFSWFRDYPGKIEWLPIGKQHRHIIGEASPSGLQNISADELIKLFNGSD